MRKKQVLALLLAGCMTFGSVPVWAAGTDVPQSAEETSENTETIDTLQGEETPTPTETPKTLVQEGENEVNGDNEETPTPEATPTETATPTPTVTETPAAEENTVFVDTKGYASLAEAIQDNSGKSSLTIVLKGDQTLDETLVVPAGMTLQISAEKNVNISRSASAKSASVKVSEGAVLKLSKASGEGTITVKGAQKADSPLFEVEGSLEITDGVTIQDNHSSGTAGAIYNKGTVTMTGGTIKGNTSDGAGAIYNVGTLKLSGSVVISDNHKTGNTAKSNIVLSGQSVVTLAGKLSSSAKVGIQAVNAKEGQTVVKAASGVNLSENLDYITYEGSDAWKIGTDGTLESTTIADTTGPELTEVSVERISDAIALITFRSDEAGRYYVSLDDPEVDTSGNGMKLRENMDTEYQITDLTAGEHTLFIIAKDAAGNPSNILTVRIPAAAEEVQVANPDDNTINGIAASYNRSYYDSNAKVYKYFVSFSATGAGMDYPDKEGNVRYEPISWGIGDLKNQTFREGYRGSFSGNVDPGTYQLEVVFQQQEYNGTEWVSTGETDTKTVDIVLNDAGPTVSPTPTTRPSGTNRSGSGSGSGSGTGTSKASNASTGDNTNAAPMVVLGGSAAALAAAAVVMKKKRQSEE